LKSSKTKLKFCVTGGTGFIGSNLIDILIKKKASILNLDLNKPIDPLHLKYWFKSDINNQKSFEKVLQEFNPDYLIHLAADATMDGRNLDDYKTNTVGVENLINVINKLKEKLIFIAASSQHVRKPGTYIYKSSKEYNPLGLYGESKVITEQLIMNSNLKQKFFIIRPTLVWGPRNYMMANAIFSYINKNIYYHPTTDNTVRAYGYVENLCDQILKLCYLDESIDCEKILYLADHNMLQQEWITLATQFMGKGNLKTLPSLLLKIGSYFGDYIKPFYKKYPLYTERYLNLTTSNPIPLEKTFSIIGEPKINIETGMQKTAAWLKKFYEVN